MKKISVVTVTYNCGSLVQRTLESVALQNPTLVEHIVIDGGSRDETLKFLSPYLPRLAHFVSEPDQGIYDAMNKGIAATSGEWVLFLNAGDTFHENFRAEDLSFVWPARTEFVVFPYIVEGQGTARIPDLNMLFGMPTSHQGMLVSSEALRESGLNTRYRVAADYDFYLKRRRKHGAGVAVEGTILSRVQPGGYSAAHIRILRQDYQRIVFRYLGPWSAVVHYLWCRPALFRGIKKLLPIRIFKLLRGSL